MQDDSLAASLQLCLEEVCDRFEAAWKAAASPATAPRVEDYLEAVAEPCRAALLRELLRVDVHYRRRHGENPDADFYTARCPANAQAVRHLFARLFGEPPRQGASAAGDDRTGTADPATPPEVKAGRYPAPANYEILGELGRGGMGIVYKAQQANPKRLVALKMILSGQLASSAEVQRFHTEAEAAARLDHPNIVPIYEVGEHEGQPYFSMKLIEGGSLADTVLRPLAASSDRARNGVRVLAQVARAVHHAHQRGILHRDLKPGNILLDGQGQPHVTDFGLAKRVEASVPHTRTGAIIGTPNYMAPEQARSEKVLTTAVDVYGLGSILYELLTGRPPFRAETPLDTILQVLEREPVPPRRVNSRVDRDLQTICLKCLEKEPQRRYGSAEALAEDLERWLEGEPIRARPAPGGERLLKWVKRRPAAAALLVVSSVAALALAGALVGVWYSGRLQDALEETRVQRGEADEQRQEAERQKARAEGQEDLVKRLLYLSNMNLAERAWQAADLELLDRVLKETQPEPGQKDLRGFEWHHLRRLRHHSALRTLPHGNYVMSLDWSPDGSRLATATNDGTVRVWDAEAGKEVLTRREASGVWSVRWSPDGKRLVVCAGDKSVKVWDAGSGHEIQTFRGHAEEKARVLSLSPDGKRLATAGMDMAVMIWDAQTGRSTLTLKGHTSGVTSVDWSPDGKALASAGHDRAVKIWDAETGRELRTLNGGTNVQAVSWSPDGKRLASSWDRTIRVWDAGTGAETLTLKGHRQTVFGLAWSPNGKRLASVDGDGPLRIWDASSGQQELLLRSPGAGIRSSVSWRPDGKCLASTGGNLAVNIWDAEEDRQALVLRGHSGPVSGLSWAGDGKRLATTSLDGTLRVWDAETGRGLRTFKDAVNGVAWSPDGRRLASASYDQRVKVRDMNTRQDELVIEGRVLRCICWSPDGKRLAGCSFDLAVVPDAGASTFGLLGAPFSPGPLLAASTLYPFRVVRYQSTVRVWNAETGRELLLLKGHAGNVCSISWSPDGRCLASSAAAARFHDPGEVKVWDAETGRELRTFQGFGNMWSVCWSRDGKLLASVSLGYLWIWDLSGVEKPRSLRVGGGDVLWVSWSPDGKRLATPGGDGTVKLWDAQTRTGELRPARSPGPGGTWRVWDYEIGREALTIEAHAGMVQSACWSPDGKRLATASDDHTVKIWDSVPPPLVSLPRKPVAELRSFLGHTGHITTACLSADGRRALSGGFDRTVRLWDVDRAKEIRRLEGHTDIVWAVALSPDGKRALSASQDRTVRLWDVENGRLLHRMEGHGATVGCVTFLPGSRYGLSSCWDRTVRLWDLDSGREWKRFDVGMVVTVAVFPDGKRALFGSNDGYLGLWDLEAGKELRRLACPSDSINSLAISADEKRAAAAHADGAVRLYDLDSGKEVGRLDGHSDSVTSVAFSPDGRRLLSSGLDKTVRLWDAASGRELCCFEGHRELVGRALFTPDGRHALSASYDRSLRLWKLPQ
jgi:WD40 repeat protein